MYLLALLVGDFPLQASFASGELLSWSVEDRYVLPCSNARAVSYSRALRYAFSMDTRMTDREV